MSFSSYSIDLLCVCVCDFPSGYSEDLVEGSESVTVNSTARLQPDGAVDSRAQRSLSQLRQLEAEGEEQIMKGKSRGRSPFLHVLPEHGTSAPRGLTPATWGAGGQGLAHPSAGWGRAGRGPPAADGAPRLPGPAPGPAPSALSGACEHRDGVTPPARSTPATTSLLQLPARTLGCVIRFKDNVSLSAHPHLGSVIDPTNTASTFPTFSLSPH